MGGAFRECRIAPIDLYPNIDSTPPANTLRTAPSLLADCLLITANVNSFKTVSTVKAFDKRLREKRVFAAGFQEARTKHVGYDSTDSYYLVSSAAARGNFGCQLWRSKLLPGCDNASKDSLSIIVQEPRLLPVVAQVSFATLCFVVGHVPT